MTGQENANPLILRILENRRMPLDAVRAEYDGQRGMTGRLATEAFGTLVHGLINAKLVDYKSADPPTWPPNSPRPIAELWLTAEGKAKISETSQ